MYKNLTPHVLKFPDGKIIGPSPPTAEVFFELRTIRVEGIKIVSQEVRDHNLPDPEEEVYLIVPSIVRLAFPERRDLLSVSNLNKVFDKITVFELRQNSKGAYKDD